VNWYANAMFGAVMFAVIVLAIGWWLASPRPKKRRRGKRARP
jgi:hypothetical protein